MWKSLTGHECLARRFLCQRLNSVDVDRVRSFRALCDLERYFVTFPKVGELYVLELIGVEKEIFFTSFTGDEAEASVAHETSNSSCLH